MRGLGGSAKLGTGIIAPLRQIEWPPLVAAAEAPASRLAQPPPLSTSPMSPAPPPAPCFDLLEGLGCGLALHGHSAVRAVALTLSTATLPLASASERRWRGGRQRGPRD